MKHPRDLTNLRFGRLTVLGKAETTKSGTKWNCICDCGSVKKVFRGNLLKENTMSCGCLNKQIVRERDKSTHKMTGSHFYKIWANMKYRCNNKNRKAYRNYGGRGISVCNEWDSFEGFKKDMYERYLIHSSQHSQSQTTLDRIDENDDYKPSNCRWATKNEQFEHKRTNVSTVVDGISYNSLSELARKHDLPVYWVSSRYKRGYRDTELTDKELYENNKKIFGSHKKRGLK